MNSRDQMINTTVDAGRFEPPQPPQLGRGPANPATHIKPKVPCTACSTTGVRPTRQGGECPECAGEGWLVVEGKSNG